MGVLRNPAGLAFAATALAVAAITAPSCGTDAVGIEACRRIEYARCEAAPACRTDFDVELCKDFYRDHCLHGIENENRAPSDSEVDACVSAIEALAACAKAATPLGDCPGVTLVPGAPEGADVCAILVGKQDDATGVAYGPHLLSACAFVAQPAAPDAGAPDGTGGGGMGGAGGAGGGSTGSTGGTSTTTGGGGDGGTGNAGSGGTGVGMGGGGGAMGGAGGSMGGAAGSMGGAGGA